MPESGAAHISFGKTRKPPAMPFKFESLNCLADADVTTVFDIARKTIDMQIDALKSMRNRLDDNFRKAVDIILDSKGRLVVMGMGKSGIIGRKIAATLASTGTPSFFVHPGEAFHGDLGMILPDDVVLMISTSGETEEIIRLLPFMEHQDNVVIAMTGKIPSTLSRHADAVLDVSVEREACKNNLAPTSSTTATLVMGDALASVLAELKDFQPDDFARFHPGGSLGRKLLTRVCDVMHRENLPVCNAGDSFTTVVQTMTRGRLGLALVMENESFCGIITDGDLRRALDRGGDFMALQACGFMTGNPKTARPEERFSDAEERMRAMKINSLVVLDEHNRIQGVLQIYDLKPGTPAL